MLSIKIKLLDDKNITSHNINTHNEIKISSLEKIITYNISQFADIQYNDTILTLSKRIKWIK